jgi:NAD(P)-dependent dehydrogenase (short-subunit alcohol dehydrogenase family)
MSDASNPTALPLAGTGALITGGGSGIGLGAARHLLRDGATVTLFGRDEGRLAAGAASLADATPAGAEVRTVSGDTATEADVQRAVEVAAEGQGLHWAVLSAGTGTMGPVIATPLSEWERVMSTNLTGAFLAMKHTGAAIARAGGGAIVAISSIAAPLTHPYMAPYCVSKTGLETLVKNAADELGRAGVRVNAIRPGLVVTELADPLLADEAVLNDYLAQMPISRVGTVDDTGAAIRFLCGPESTWITGQVLGVDGGHSLRRGPDVEHWATALYGEDIVAGRA